MSTEAKITANIANSQHSTGPRTEAGRAESSKNSLKHGLTATQTVLLPGEDEAAYRKLHEEAIAFWAPIIEPELALVRYLCDVQWRLSRCGRLEAVLLSADTPDFKSLDIISKHEARLKKSYSTTHQELRDAIASRVNLLRDKMNEAVTIRRAGLREGIDTDPSEFGFVFSREEVDAAIRREDALRGGQERLGTQHQGTENGRR
jgi:hypothetical protein